MNWPALVKIVDEAQTVWLSILVYNADHFQDVIERELRRPGHTTIEVVDR